MKKNNLKKSDRLVAGNAFELAELLGLDEVDAAEMQFKVELNNEIIKKFKAKRFTHAELAKKAGVSRTRVTALINRNTQGLSVDFMLKVLAALGYKADIKVSKIA